MAKSKRAKAKETWIGVVSLLPDGDTFAVAWVRRSDEWLADAGAAPRGSEIDALARFYLDAVEKRGHAPDLLNVRAAVHATALREAIGPGVPIKVGFDKRAEALSDAAAAAVDVAFSAQGMDEVADDHPDLAALGDRPCAYDPDRAPAPAAWLDMDEDERQLHVRAAHVLAGVDLDGQRLQLHAGMHDAVETQLARREPPETAEAIARLMGAGLDRHAAVHAVANVLVQLMHDVLTTNEPFDNAGYAAALRALRADAGA